MIRRVDPEDSELFRRAVGEVKPIVRDQQAGKVRRPAPRARFARQGRLAMLEESLRGDVGGPLVGAADELSYKRAGVKDEVLHKLRRGEYPVRGELDLHGMTALEATHALRGYLANALLEDARCVRIVHGKGLRSGPRGPILKNVVNTVLRRSGEIIAFVSARQIDGGTGAVYVLLNNTTT